MILAHAIGKRTQELLFKKNMHNRKEIIPVITISLNIYLLMVQKLKNYLLNIIKTY